MAHFFGKPLWKLSFSSTPRQCGNFENGKKFTIGEDSWVGVDKDFKLSGDLLEKLHGQDIYFVLDEKPIDYVRAIWFG